MWVSLSLAGGASSVSEARRSCLDLMHAGGVSDDDASCAAIVVTELVSNAFRHTAGPCVVHIKIEEGIRIQVWDSDPSILELPRKAMKVESIDNLSCGGYGLGIVAEISKEFRTYPAHSGKVVEVVIPASGDYGLVA
ncbi:ATP-binding protein [Streptomyces erythrochromogenes]|uniref:ATP-binding protein n=1 Tax=Streptomyces erythrochromogenes TaxID=285574 RepID=UPI0036992642